MACIKVSHKVLQLSTLVTGKTWSPQLQILRHRGGVSFHRKPRWLPVAPSKKFLLEPEDHTPDNEIEQILKLKFHHREKMAAITQYLWEEHLRNSDVGQAAILEAEREDAEHKSLVEQNEETNRMIAKSREERLKKLYSEDEKRIKEEVAGHKEKLLTESKNADDWLAQEQSEIESKIRVQDLERAIETALDNPIDPEFAIDLKGYIYRGRQTKSIEVPEDQKEKIPAPPTVAEKILTGKEVIQLRNG